MLRAALAAVVLATAATGASPHLTQAPACTIFPASSPWNRRVDTLPGAADSAAIVAAIGVADNLHADFGSGTWDGAPIGIPYTVVSGTQPRSRVTFEYDDESDHVGYPIPAHPKVEGGSDRHVLLVDKS